MWMKLKMLLTEVQENGRQRIRNRIGTKILRLRVKRKMKSFLKRILINYN